MERRSTKTTSLIEDIADIEGSTHTRFSHATIKITPSSEIKKYSENESSINRKDKNCLLYTSDAADDCCRV